MGEEGDEVLLGVDGVYEGGLGEVGCLDFILYWSLGRRKGKENADRDL